MVGGAVARRFCLSGPRVNVAAACATGIHSVSVACGWLKENRCRYVLAGAAESSLHPLYWAGFQRLGVLSPKGEVRPFDINRSGFVLVVFPDLNWCDVFH